MIITDSCLTYSIHHPLSHRLIHRLTHLLLLKPAPSILSNKISTPFQNINHRMPGLNSYLTLLCGSSAVHWAALIYDRFIVWSLIVCYIWSLFKITNAEAALSRFLLILNQNTKLKRQGSFVSHFYPSPWNIHQSLFWFATFEIVFRPMQQRQH